MFESLRKFLLVENFSWLLDNLDKFVDPQYTYKKQGSPNLKGGARRMYRSANHQQYYDYQAGATVTSNGTKIIQFPAHQVECEEWLVSHDTFSDQKLKEKYPKAQHVCLVTSRDTFKKNKASSYYISCTCQDFRTTAEEELVNNGYCKPQSPALPPATGKKKLSAMPCKHLYTILVRYYNDIIKSESDLDPSSEYTPMVHPVEPPTPEKLTKTATKWLDKRRAQSTIGKPMVAEPEAEAEPETVNIIPDVSKLTKTAQKQLAKRLSQAPLPVDPTSDMPDPVLKQIAKKVIASSLKLTDATINTFDINSYRKTGTKKVHDYKFFVMRNVGGFGYYGVSGYNAIGVMVGGKRMPLKFISNGQEVDKQFLVKLYSLFTPDELIQLIQQNTTKRPADLIQESVDRYEYIPGVLVEDSATNMFNIISMIG